MGKDKQDCVRDSSDERNVPVQEFEENEFKVEDTYCNKDNKTFTRDRLEQGWFPGRPNEDENVDVVTVEQDSNVEQKSNTSCGEGCSATPPPCLMEPIVEMTSPVDHNKHICHQCGKFYKQKGTLAFHLRYECGKEPQFSCDFCDYKAKRKTSLNSHVAFKHKDMINIYLSKT